jgi:hypothetical protein
MLGGAVVPSSSLSPSAISPPPGSPTSAPGSVAMESSGENEEEEEGVNSACSKL